jgi:hypothetical protein
MRVPPPERRRGIAALSVAGIVVIIGLLAMSSGSPWIGVIVVIVGLFAFGALERALWY